ncbi:MAG: hypothetical protein U9Q96_02130 [Patescibacteria group bacterium]|nr:hypothetical protein [Patescibacteria group bacterium]
MDFFLEISKRGKKEEESGLLRFHTDFFEKGFLACEALQGTLPYVLDFIYTHSIIKAVYIPKRRMRECKRKFRVQHVVASLPIVCAKILWVSRHGIVHDVKIALSMSRRLQKPWQRLRLDRSQGRSLRW